MADKAALTVFLKSLLRCSFKLGRRAPGGIQMVKNSGSSRILFFSRKGFFLISFSNSNSNFLLAAKRKKLDRAISL